MFRELYPLLHRHLNLHFVLMLLSSFLHFCRSMLFLFLVLPPCVFCTPTGISWGRVWCFRSVIGQLQKWDWPKAIVRTKITAGVVLQVSHWSTSEVWLTNSNRPLSWSRVFIWSSRFGHKSDWPIAMTLQPWVMGSKLVRLKSAQ